jgi:hypothetical protein
LLATPKELQQSLLVSSGIMATTNAAASKPDDRSGDQVKRKAPPEMVWIPGRFANFTFSRGWALIAPSMLLSRFVIFDHKVLL